MPCSQLWCTHQIPIVKTHSLLLIKECLPSPPKYFDLVAPEIKPLRNINLISFVTSPMGLAVINYTLCNLRRLWNRRFNFHCSHLSKPVRLTMLLKDFIPQTFQLSFSSGNFILAAQKSNHCAAFPYSPENGNSVLVPPVNLGSNPKPTESIKKLLFVPAGLNHAQWVPCEHGEHI